MVYSVDPRMEEYFRSDSLPKSEDWLVMDLESMYKVFPADEQKGKLRFRHMRFIRIKGNF